MHVPNNSVMATGAANAQGPHGSVEPRTQDLPVQSRDPTNNIRQLWQKSLESKSKPLVNKVQSGLYDPIIDALHEATKTGPESTQRASDRIRELLGTQGSKYSIDDCVLWLILRDAVEYADPESWEGRDARRLTQVAPSR